MIAHGGAVEMAARPGYGPSARIGELTGEEVTDAVLDTIFSQFCVGEIALVGVAGETTKAAKSPESQIT